MNADVSPIRPTLARAALGVALFTSIPLSTYAQTPSSKKNGLIRHRASLGFVANRGQFDDGIHFVGRTAASTAVLREDGIQWILYECAPKDRPGTAGSPSLVTKAADFWASDGASTVRMQFDGATSGGPIEGVDRHSAYANFFIGRDQSRWASHVPTYRSVAYRSIYPGVDVILSKDDASITYDIVLEPGARPSDVVMRFTGANRLSITNSGSLVVDTGANEHHHTRPRALAIDESGHRREVPCAFALIDKDRVTFQAPDIRADERLVIDPQVVNPFGIDYFTYLGGSAGGEVALDVALDSAKAVITGTTRSWDFPTVVGSYDTTFNGTGFDVFVSQLNVAGTALLWSTFVGGGNTGDVYDHEAGYGVAVGSPSGSTTYIWVAGATSNVEQPGGDFPTTSAFGTPIQATSVDQSGGVDGFALLLSGDGANLWMSTLLSGYGRDYALDIATDNSFAYVTGYTSSSTADIHQDFLGSKNGLPTPGVVEPTFLGGNTAGFVIKIDALLHTLVFATYVRSISPNSEGVSTECTGIDLRSDPNESGKFYPCVTGRTSNGLGSGTVPITSNAFQPTAGTPVNSVDGFVAELNDTATSYNFGSYLGGEDVDLCRGIDVSDNGIIALTGTTSSIAFPVVNPFQPSLSGASDAFIARVDPDATSPTSSLLSSSYLGGESDEDGLDIWINSSGRRTYVTGRTASTPFKVTADALLSTNQGGFDAFLSEAHNNALVFSTHLGGALDDTGLGITVSDDSVYIVGRSLGSTFYATMNSLSQANLPGYQTTNNGSPAFGGAFPLHDHPLPDIMFIQANQDAFVIRLEDL